MPDKIWANSGDSHFVEPEDLWTRTLSPELAERMPRHELFPHVSPPAS